MVFSRRPFTRSQVREAREATLKDDNFGSQHLDMDYPITLTDDSFPMDPPAVDMANPTDDNFDVDSDSPAALLPVCPCGSVEAFHYCYSGMPDFVGPNAGAWAQSNVSIWLYLAISGPLKYLLLCSKPRSHVLPSIGLASWDLFVFLFYCLLRKKLTARYFLSEVYDLVHRRWRLSNSSGPQTAEAERILCNTLGWENPVLKWSNVSFFSSVCRFLYFENQWIFDIKEMTYGSCKEAIELLSSCI